MEEIWKDIPDYEGLYQVSNIGRVKSLDRLILLNNKSVLKRGRILKSRVAYSGYSRVVLYKESKNKNFSVHRLVAMTFIPNPDNKCHVDHINTVRTDNRVENLRWATTKENANNPLTIAAHSKSQSNGVSHFNRDIYGAKPIIRISQDGSIVEYPSIAEAVRLGFAPKKIQRCCQGKRLLYLGYDWRYKENDPKPPINIKEALKACNDFKKICRSKGDEIVLYNSLAEAAGDGFDPSTINKCIKGKRKHHKGYAWTITTGM